MLISCRQLRHAAILLFFKIVKTKRTQSHSKHLEEEEGSPEKFDEQELLPLVAAKVVEGEDQRFHELGVGLRHREHQPATDQTMFRPMCCGSGSGAFLTPGSGMGTKSGSGSGMNNPDHISESLETIFWVKILLKFFDADLRSGMEKIRIRNIEQSNVEIVWFKAIISFSFVTP
jgi:hypothetical protein